MDLAGQRMGSRKHLNHCKFTAGKESLCLTEERHGLGEGHPDTSAIRNELRSPEPKETEELVFISPSLAFRWGTSPGPLC